MLQRMIKAMDAMDELQLDEIISAAAHRRNGMFPNNEYVVLSVPRDDPEERKRLLAYVIDLVDREEREKAAARGLGENQAP